LRTSTRSETRQHVALSAIRRRKTTLLSLVLRLYDPVSGRVLIDGRDVREFTLESLRRKSASSSRQRAFRQQLSATHRLRLVAPKRSGADATLEQVHAAAKLANAHEFISAFAQGYETSSASARQRFARPTPAHRHRARAIRQAPILILDEPTTGLDRPINAKCSESSTGALLRLAKRPITPLQATCSYLEPKFSGVRAPEFASRYTISSLHCSHVRLRRREVAQGFRHFALIGPVEAVVGFVGDQNRGGDRARAMAMRWRWPAKA